MAQGRSRKGQALSVDLVIGVLIFLVALGAIYSLLGSRQQEDPTPLRIESEVIATILTSNASSQQLQVADNNQLSMDQLGMLAHQAQGDYGSLKEQLGIKNEFCIYLQDDQGNLVYIRDQNGTRYSGIGSGSDDLNVSGVECGRPVK